MAIGLSRSLYNEMAMDVLDLKLRVEKLETRVNIHSTSLEDINGTLVIVREALTVLSAAAQALDPRITLAVKQHEASHHGTLMVDIEMKPEVADVTPEVADVPRS
jgi:hypothetical protein